MTRPIGVAPGSVALAAAWAAGLLIALLTGAAAVVILLVTAFVGLLLAAAGGWIALRGSSVVRLATSDVVAVGDEVKWSLALRSATPLWAEVSVSGEIVAAGPVADGENTLVGTSPRRGVHHEAEVRCLSAGSSGLVWWRRSAHLALAPLRVGAALCDDGAPIARTTSARMVGAAPANRIGRDLPDGVRPWRDGDEASTIHWPSSLRNRDLVVRQQLADADELWIVHARSGTGDPDAEAGRVRTSLEAGLREGASVAVRIDDGEVRTLASLADVVRWSAEFESEPAGSPRAQWWRRARRLTAVEPCADLSSPARWVVAAAGAVPFVMLLQPLGYGVGPIAVAIAAAAVSAAVTTRTGSRVRGIRQAAGLLAAGCVAVALIDPARITSVAASLRFLMPQTLIVLVILQGFECVDRRSARVSLACAATITAYGAGVRVDDRLALWLLLACPVIVWAYRTVARPADGEGSRRRTHRVRARSAVGGRRVVGQLGGLALGISAVVAILALLPVPRGPAQLTLPSWLQERRDAGDGDLAAPDGSPLLGGTSGRRGGTGEGTSAGSYAGFSPRMDTALRGALGDEVVLRVKAPNADYWRGQTYVHFDGRTWSVDERGGIETAGPDHDIRPAEGDASWSGDEFLQTFYVEVDLPNLVFAASSARRVLLDAPLWQRPDGALRAGFVLPAGSAYTVVSERSKPTAAALRSSGDVSTLTATHEYLQLPDSTTQRVRDLAQQFALGSPSTYDTIVKIHEWLGRNVEYDLDAPVPPAGADAVDDFLFESQLGFCEQIASATAIMLRALGVPARVATGFVPSSRDAVAGVWISRARDAHAWVEVHFPQYGWVAFDPTASVPLSGDAGSATIGGELFSAVSGWVAARIVPILGLVVVLGSCSTIVRVLRRWRERRRRGRWGLLQDRFVAAAMRRGAAGTATNAQLAETFDTPRADAVAQVLDSSAFSPSWVDDDAEFARIAADVRVLEAVAAGRQRERPG